MNGAGEASFATEWRHVVAKQHHYYVPANSQTVKGRVLNNQAAVLGGLSTLP
jgi:hypothetical protein